MLSLRGMQTHPFLLLILLLLVAFAVSADVAVADEGSILSEAEPLLPPADDAVRVSDSPHLRLPSDLLNAEPVIPYRGLPGRPPADPTATITYDLASGETTITPSSAYSQQRLTEAVQQLQQFEGHAPSMMTPSGDTLFSPIGVDDRSRINSTGSYPWRSIARLVIRWESGSNSVGACTGAIIDSYHILTAGHCVFDYGGTDDWAFSIQIFPGIDDDYTPYNHAWPARFHSYTGWTSSGMSEHDWAVIALDRNIGDHTGWMGRETADSGDSVYTGVLNVAGYPGTPPNSETCPSWANCMYFDSDNGHSSDATNHWYWMDTSGGMSGGPVWRYFSGNGSRYILSTHTCGTGGCGITSNSVNHGTRLDQDKYDRITTWINGDSDITPTDRPDMIDDGDSFSGFTPTTVVNGGTFSAWSDTRNIGTANTGGFYVSYYASTNNLISTSDYLIGSTYISNITPFSWANANLTNITFPNGIPEGDYYVGWIIDRFSTVTEYVENNNTAYKANTQLTVCNTPAAPALVSPSNGARTTDRTPTLDWGFVSGVEYRIQVDDNSSFSSPYIDTTVNISDYTSGFNWNFGTYYWRVRSEKDCGANSAWTTSRALNVVSTGPLNYLTYSVDDDKLNNSYGNDNSIADCGETVELYVTLRNYGSDYATTPNMTLSTDDSRVTILHNTSSSYPTINGSQDTAVNNDDYDIQISAPTSNGVYITFDTSTTSVEGGPWDDTFSLYVVCSPPPTPFNFRMLVSTNNNGLLNWGAVNAENYEVWHGVNDPYFTPTTDCAAAANCTVVTTNSYNGTGIMGDGDLHTYVLQSVSIGGLKSTAVNRVGKFDFALDSTP